MATPLRELIRRHGLVGGALQRLRAGMDLAGVDDRTVSEQARRVDGLSRELDDVRHGLVAVEASTGEWDSTAAFAEQVETLASRLVALERRTQGCEAALAAHRPANTVDLLALTTLHGWLEALPPLDAPPPLVSVVMPTRERPTYLARALRSLEAQVHTSWEALVVDDGETPAAAAAAVVEAAGDPRIQLVAAQPGRGASAARNSGLAAARGPLVAYLDDDCVMGPLWLAAVARAFALDADLEVAYGARILFHDGRLRYLQIPFDRAQLERGNVADTNVLAHRRELPEAHWDEDLRCGADWDLLSRLTLERAPEVIPVLAAVYDHTAPGRLSATPQAAQDYARVRRRVAARRPLRILGVNAMFPLLSETYIHDELHALELRGAELAWCRVSGNVPASMPVDQPVFTDLDEAVSSFRPDVLVLHWATFAHSQRERLARLGVPYGVRVHSFDFDPGLVADLLAEPLCVGVWRYPSPAYDTPGTHSLPPIFSTVARLPTHDGPRRLVLSASAGLPKKDWPLLARALGALEGVDARIVTGLTVGHEEEPQRVVDLCHAEPFPPLVQINCTRDVVHGLLSRTALFVYTLVPDARFGMPMSIVEALCAGCSVVVPDRPEALAFAGPNVRTYRTAEDIAAHARDVLAGGPSVLAEQQANRAWGLAHFCDPAVPDAFMEQLRAGLAGQRAEAGLAASGL